MPLLRCVAIAISVTWMFKVLVWGLSCSSGWTLHCFLSNENFIASYSVCTCFFLHWCIWWTFWHKKLLMHSWFQSMLLYLYILFTIIRVLGQLCLRISGYKFCHKIYLSSLYLYNRFYIFFAGVWSISILSLQDAKNYRFEKLYIIWEL